MFEFKIDSKRAAFPQVAQAVATQLCRHRYRKGLFQLELFLSLVLEHLDFQDYCRRLLPSLVPLQITLHHGRIWPCYPTTSPKPVALYAQIRFRQHMSHTLLLLYGAGPMAVRLISLVTSSRWFGSSVKPTNTAYVWRIICDPAVATSKSVSIRRSHALIGIVDAWCRR